MKLLASILLPVLACGCKWQFERMLVQHKVHDDDPVRLALLAVSPVPGTVPHPLAAGAAAATDRDAFQTGCSAAAYAPEVPLAVTPDLLAVGKQRFGTYCATCHGPDGQGHTAVAEAMEIEKPKSLVAGPVRDYPPGRVFRTVTFSYKRMPSYRNELDERERWAVIAYVRSLPAGPPPDAAHTPVPSPGPVCPEQP